MSSEAKKYEEKFGLEMQFDEALERFSNASKSEENETSETLSLIPEGEFETTQFKGIEVRKILHAGEWWFSIIDVVGAISETANPKRYWSDLKRKIVEKEGFYELNDNIVHLKLPTADGKIEPTEVCTTETLLRLIQSMRTPKAEPFKRWLAKVGYERIQEAQNPEIAIKRAILTYQLQGRSDDWIDKRIRSIVTRKELTSEWKKRGVEEGRQYAALSNIISMKTFGMSVKVHKEYKGLKSQNLRDHMSDLELIFTMLGEKSTTEVAQARDAQGFQENVNAANVGGGIAGSARLQLEKETKIGVATKQNFVGNRKRTADPELLSSKGIETNNRSDL